VAHAQAEELPPASVDNLPALAAPQAPASPVSARVTPGPAPSPLVAPSAAVARRHGWVFIPYFGFNLPAAATAKSYSAGFRMGGLAGWSLTQRFSVNGEFTLDFMDGDTDSSILKPHEHYLDFVLSPLFHFRSSAIVVGPKLGWFTNSRSFSDSDLQEHNGQGFLFGVNAGGFVPFGKLAIGLLASGTFRHFTTVGCGPYPCAGDYGLVTVLSLSVAALF
jgi:hypothetical protein